MSDKRQRVEGSSSEGTKGPSKPQPRGTASSSMAAVAHLQKQLQELKRSPIGGFSVEVGDNLFEWTIWFAGPKGTLYHPGQYKAVMTFPQDFPFKPPEFKVLSAIWHPNVYPDGRVCISILHAPGVDEHNALESAMERWTPIQSVDKVLISIVSLLADPDPEGAGAPANVDALAMYRRDRKTFDEKCRANAAKSLQELPPGYVPPPEDDAKPAEEKPRVTLMDSEPDAEDDGAGEAAHTHKYSTELESIRNMGCGAEHTDEQLLEMLEKYKGDVSRVLERLM